VLDTNVVLDCFVFRNVGCLPLRSALENDSVRWVATPAMREELAHVLGRGFDARWRADPAAVMAAWDRGAQLLPEPARSSLYCTDPDDQKFIDLALALNAPWLLTRDRAVLKLARRARLQGVQIVPPERWSEAGVIPEMNRCM